MTTKEHYDTHLANFYEWMAGDFEAKQTEQYEFFVRNRINPLHNRKALDLGAGHGLQSIPLAQLNFHVTAVDFNTQLLESLSVRAGQMSIITLQNDLLAEGNFENQVEVIACMGDTIAHLESTAHIRLLFDRCFECIVKKGKIILSYRDYGTELTDTQRFIQVKSDESKILTCVLEYFDDKVRVTDLLHEKINGKWTQKASSYFKIRITELMIDELVTKSGFKILTKELINRMNYLIAEKN